MKKSLELIFPLFLILVIFDHLVSANIQNRILDQFPQISALTATFSILFYFSLKLKLIKRKIFAFSFFTFILTFTFILKFSNLPALLPSFYTLLSFLLLLILDYISKEEKIQNTVFTKLFLITLFIPLLGIYFTVADITSLFEKNSKSGFSPVTIFIIIYFLVLILKNSKNSLLYYSLTSKQSRQLGTLYHFIFVFLIFFLLLYLLKKSNLNQTFIIAIYGAIFVVVVYYFILQNIQHFRSVSTESDLFKSLLENAPDSIVIINENGKIQMVNAQTQLLFGYTSEELIGQYIEVLLPERFRETHISQRVNYFKNPIFRGMGVGLDLFGKRKDNTEFDVEISISPIKTQKGLFVSASIRDISERKKTRRELQKSEEKWVKLFSLLPIGITILNKNGAIMEINPVLEKILGITKEGLLNEEYRKRKYIHEDGREYLPNEFPSRIALTENIEVLSKIIGVVIEDGTTVWTEVSASPLPYEDAACVIVTKDFTKIKKYESDLEKLLQELSNESEKLENSNEELTKFAHIISHDLQEPLRMITSFLSLLKDHLADKFDETAIEYMDFATDGAARMKELILDLLNYARIGNQEYKFKSVNLNNIMKDILQLNSILITEKKVIVNIDDLPQIYCNGSTIMQVFGNLITNAIKYQNLETQPILHIRALERPDQWLFSVSDNGIGIEKEYFAKIFVVFQRLHAKDEYSGTGIGLAICKKIIEKHKGKIWLESELGKGTTFYFTIPKNL